MTNTVRMPKTIFTPLLKTSRTQRQMREDSTPKSGCIFGAAKRKSLRMTIAEMDDYLEELKRNVKSDISDAVQTREEDLNIDNMGNVRYGDQKLPLPAVGEDDLN